MAEGGACSQVLFTCIICGQEDQTENEMKSHILIEHIEQEPICPFCDLSGITPDEMTLHINAGHQDIFEFETGFCSKDQLSPTNENMSLNKDVHDDTHPLMENERIVDISTDDQIPLNDMSSSADIFSDEPSEVSGSVSNLDMYDDNMSRSGGLSLDSDICQSPPVNRGNSSDIDLFDDQLSPVNNGHEKSGTDDQNSEDIILDESSSAGAVIRKKSDSVEFNVQEKRSSLHLPVETNLNVSVTSLKSESDTPLSTTSSGLSADDDTDEEPGGYLSCPFCSFQTKIDKLIENHVNSAHLDVISPMNESTHSGPHNGEPLRCLFCTLTFESDSALEVHINFKHSDILSPNSCKTIKEVNDDLEVNMKRLSQDESSTCPMCGEYYHDTGVLALHVERHFAGCNTPETSDHQLAQEWDKREKERASREKQEFEALQKEYGMDEKGNYRRQYEQNLEKDVCMGRLTVNDYHRLKTHLNATDISGNDDGHTSTSGIIDKLRAAYSRPMNNINRAWLCSEVSHYSTSYGDRGWGCGYRNLQMLLSSLACNKEYCKVLFNGKPNIPSVPKTQRLIEAAWHKGFDKQGCEQLGGRVVNTRKWIGATDIIAMLSALSIKVNFGQNGSQATNWCRLIDFHAPTGPNNTHVKLFEWVKNYFENQSGFIPPLYLQHQGHSRTIIGIEELRDRNLRLLLFDPGTNKTQMEKLLINVNRTNLQMLRRGIQGLKSKQYQIIAIVGILSDREYQESKVIKSERIS